MTDPGVPEVDFSALPLTAQVDEILWRIVNKAGGPMVHVCVWTSPNVCDVVRRRLRNRGYTDDWYFLAS